MWYGPLGIVLAKKNPQAFITLVDKDLFAVRYTNLNLKKNNIQNAESLGSIGMEEVLDKTSDLIVSNVPAKIGDRAIREEFILTPYKHLNTGGELWVVVVNALNHLIPKIGSQYQLKMRLVKKKSGHSVYMIKH